MSLHTLHRNRQKLLIQRIRVILKTLHHQEQPQEGAGDKQSSGEAFSEGDRVTHSSKADEGRVFIVSGFKDAIDGDYPYYVLAFEEGCKTAVNCQFNPSKLKKLSS